MNYSGYNYINSHSNMIHPQLSHPHPIYMNSINKSMVEMLQFNQHIRPPNHLCITNPYQTYQQQMILVPVRIISLPQSSMLQNIHQTSQISLIPQIQPIEIPQLPSLPHIITASSPQSTHQIHQIPHIQSIEIPLSSHITTSSPQSSVSPQTSEQFIYPIASNTNSSTSTNITYNSCNNYKNNINILHSQNKNNSINNINKSLNALNELNESNYASNIDGTFTCLFDISCGKTFSHRSSLFRHKTLYHDGHKPFLCKFNGCNMSFGRRHLLNLHKRVHSGEKPYKCPDKLCKKSFKQKAHLTEHIRMHTGEKPYVCEFCDKRFRQKAVLDTHRRRHTGERPYKCKLCGKDFAHYTSYWRHTKKEVCLKKKKNKKKFNIV